LCERIITNHVKPFPPVFLITLLVILIIEVIFFRNYGSLPKAKLLTDVKITDACVNRLKQVSKGQALRVMVEGGGCSGFQYKFSLDEDICEDDKLVCL
jgi:hypothetical protein